MHHLLQGANRKDLAFIELAKVPSYDGFIVLAVEAKSVLSTEWDWRVSFGLRRGSVRKRIYADEEFGESAKLLTRRMPTVVHRICVLGAFPRPLGYVNA